MTVLLYVLAALGALSLASLIVLGVVCYQAAETLASADRRDER